MTNLCLMLKKVVNHLYVPTSVFHVSLHVPNSGLCADANNCLLPGLISILDARDEVLKAMACLF